MTEETHQETLGRIIPVDLVDSSHNNLEPDGATQKYVMGFVLPDRASDKQRRNSVRQICTVKR